MSETLAQLRGLSDEEIIKRHDAKAQPPGAGHPQIGVNYYLAELARRDQDRHTRAMLGYTKRIMCMTVVMTISTIVNVIITVRLLCK